MTRSSNTRPPRGDYVVGYGRPPVSGQFKPGQSGNPKGRPKAKADFGTILEQALTARVAVQENGRRRHVSMREVIVRGLVADAARRDPKALRMLMVLLQRFGPKPELAEAMVPSAEDQAILEDYLARYDQARLDKRPVAPDNAGGVAVDSEVVTSDLDERS